MNEIVLSQDINVITAEINTYQRMAGEAIFEIGRRLKHVKEKDLVHGEFGKWLEVIGMNHQHANRFMKVVDELGGTNYTTSFNLGIEALYQIATLPAEQRDQPHTIPSTGETKTVDDMTVRELREVKKLLKEKESTVDRLNEENASLSNELSQEKNKPIKVETKIIETEVDKTDYQQINKLKNDLNALEIKLANAKREKETLEEWAHLNEKDAQEYKKMKKEIDYLYSQKDGYIRQIESIKSIGTLVVEIDHLLSDKLAPVKYSRAIQEQSKEKLVMSNLQEVIERVEKWTKEMKTYLPNKNIIDVEVI